jgi:hypothetical protein
MRSFRINVNIPSRMHIFGDISCRILNFVKNFIQKTYKSSKNADYGISKIITRNNDFFIKLLQQLVQMLHAF